MSISDKLVTVAEKTPQVYDAGFTKGKTEGYSEGKADGFSEGKTEGYNSGYEAGQKSEYDRFWNSMLSDSSYIPLANCSFGGWCWNDTTFLPTHDIVAKGDAQYIFAWSRVTDLKGILEKQGVTLDLSNAQSLASSFSRTQITRLPEIDTRKSASLEYVFYSNPRLVSIDKIKLKEDGTQTLTYFMRGCPLLVDVIIEGKIGANVNVSASTSLRHDSIVSIINALSPTVTGKTLTLSKTAVDAAFEELDLAEDGTMNNYMPGSSSTEWLALADTKTNWTISLV